MSAQVALTAAATQRVQNALQTFATARAAQLKAKALYIYILGQARASLAAEEALDPSSQNLSPLRLTVRALEKVVEIKSEYISFIESHMAAFDDGLDKGALTAASTRSEEGSIHWEAGALVAFVEGDERVWLEGVAGLEKKGDVVLGLVGKGWLEKMREAEEKGVVELGGEMAALEGGVEVQEEKKVEGRLKGKARKEAKKAAAGLKK